MFPGVVEFLAWTRAERIPVCIVSHKTRHPFLGPKYDLHAAARNWIDQSLRDGGGALVPADDIYFELTKEEKLARIGTLGCSMYVDDLPEILLAPGFPEATQRLLFDPESRHEATGLQRAADWQAVRLTAEALWQKKR